MAEAPFKIIDRRSVNGWIKPVHDAAVSSTQRPVLRGADRDMIRMINGETRRSLVSIARMLYANVMPVAGAIDEIADLASGHMVAQFDGPAESSEWGRLAEEWMDDHDRVCCVAGEVYSMQQLRRLIALHVLRDGDVGILLVRTPDRSNGYPQFQIIPAHRVRSDNSSKAVVGGPFDGAILIDGCILNEAGRVIGYNVTDDQGGNAIQISSVDMRLAYIPDYADQIRGYPKLATSAIDWQDWNDSKRLELIAQKIAAAHTVLVTNPEGEATDPSLILGGGDSCSTETPVFAEEFFGGTVRYLKAGTGSSVTTLRADRPTANQQAFLAGIVRNCLYALGWSSDFSLDPTKVGGATARIVVAKCNRTLDKLRNSLLFPTARWMDGWRVSVAMQLGLLPPSNDWFRWRYQGAAHITADAKYDFDVSQGELTKGLTSVPMECARRGVDWETVLDQEINYFKVLNEKCKAAGIDPSYVFSIAKASFQQLPEVLSVVPEIADQQTGGNAPATGGDEE